MLVKHLVSAFATLILVSSSTAVAPVPTAKEPLTIQQKIVLYADEYGVSAEVMSNIINCESSMNPKAIGDNGNSYGLSQIHLPSHPDITKAQALDEDYAIEFMAKHIKDNPYMWSCYRIVYGS